MAMLLETEMAAETHLAQTVALKLRWTESVE
jgi:hypothetical protein